MAAGEGETAETIGVGALAGIAESPVAVRLPAAVLRPLQQVRPFRACAALASTWGLIAASVGAALVIPHPVTWILACLIVGRCQHALAVLMHDAAHHRLFQHRWWNDFIGHWLCARPIASHLLAYRTVHLRHHKYLLTERDPDLSLSLPFPCGRASWWRKLLRDATGISALTMRGYLVVDRTTGKLRLGPGNLLRRWSWSTGTQRALVAASVGLLFWLGYGLAFVVLWWLPLMTVYQVILRVRGVLEHAAVPDRGDPLRNARTIVTRNPIAKFFLNPHHVAYHLEHHLYPGVPHYNLPALHCALRESGKFDRALVESGYRPALQAVIGG
ncbi:MAG: fatty acid desaturase family protein [Candidatus Binatia bacterium]|nr:fatty acid desaturase family protein [Candidatus Binatia bacterium]